MSVLLPSKPTRISQGGGTSSSESPSDLVYGDSGIYIRDIANDASIQFNINGSTALTLDKFKRLGINTEQTLTYRLEINDPIGECIKMFRGNDLPVFIKNDNGFLSLDVSDRDSFGVSLNGVLKLNGIVVAATANELNYTHVAEPGIAERSKCLVLDSDKSAYGINVLSVNDLVINNSLTLDMNSDRFSLNVKNSTGKCLKLFNDQLYTEFLLEDTGDLSVYNSNGCVEFIQGSPAIGIQYPIQMTTSGEGVGIKFNTYNNQNIKRNMSSIETIVIDNQYNMENSIIKFNNMKDGSLYNTVTIRNDGNIVCNSVLELSDMRKKNIIRRSNSKESLEKINKIDIFDFTYKNDTDTIVHRGVMAQQLREIIPSAVVVGDDYTISNKEIIGYLIDSVKCLTSTVEELREILASS